MADDLLWPHYALDTLLDDAAPQECILGLMERHSERVAFSTDLVPAQVCV